MASRDKELTAEELPTPYSDIAKRIGVEHTVLLAEEFGGMTWYFPKLDRSVRPFRNAKMKAEFDGTNHRELTRKYNLTESKIRTIADVNEDRQIPLEM